MIISVKENQEKYSDKKVFSNIKDDHKIYFMKIIQKKSFIL